MAAPMKCARGKSLSILRLLRGRKYSFAQYCSTKHSISSLLVDSSNVDSVIVKGWVKSVRQHRDVVFIHVSDGSSVKPLQVVVAPSLCNRDVTFGSCVSVEGQLKESKHPGQNVELAASKIDVIGKCDPVDYPFKTKKRHPPEYVRSLPHLRPKTNTFSSLMRLRNSTTMAFHKYFQDEGFCYVHTPILTSNDCEGAGEVFSVEGENDKDGFFGHETFLNVSGQLHLEVMAGAMRRVYNFGPTFRAENSQGRHHLSEFYMVEAELAFTNSLEDIMQVMERMVCDTTKQVLADTGEDFTFYTTSTDHSGKREELDRLMMSKFERITYTEAVKLLQHHNKDFQFKVKWGCDFQKEHEQFLTRQLGNIPVFVTDFPTALKPFYARVNADEETVAAVDLLVPGVGELIGGSLREERLDVLQARLERLSLTKTYEWYLDLRRFGSAPHGGFGLGFERYLQFLLGTANIRDVIPFPRSPRNCKL